MRCIMKSYHYRGIIIMIIGALWMAGCGAKMAPPDDKIANVKMAISRAREAGADIYAPLDLKLAEEKLAEAQAAMKKEDYEKASLKAEEAQLDAQVAENKSRAEKDKKRSNDLQESVDTLKKELKRDK